MITAPDGKTEIMSAAGKPVFFLIAGEASGDQLGARLMRQLYNKLSGQVVFKGIGGPEMQAAGLELFFPHTELMHFGVIEVLRHIPRLLWRIQQTVAEILRLRPDAVISIDAPDFCFRVARQVRARSGKRADRVPLLIHYVAPTVWAWRPGRARKIARFLDLMLALFPFEPPYFIREGLSCSFVGHSLVESEAAGGNGPAFRLLRHIDAAAPLLTVLPGSRSSEIKRLLPIFKETVYLLKEKRPALQLIIPTVPHLHAAVAAEVKQWNLPVHLVEGEQDKYAAFAASNAALACSGTVALELALAKLPAVIAYKINGLTALLYRRFIRVPYANLVNIMQGKKIVPEFLQENCTPAKLAHAVEQVLSDPAARASQIKALSVTAAWLGQDKFIPSERAAETILDLIESKPRPAVLQVLPALVTGGVERGTVETVAALVKAGFRAIVASAGGPMAAEVEAAGGIHVSLPLASKNPLTVYANIARLCDIIQRFKIDVVHARSRAPAWSAFYAASRMDIPFVTTFHSAYGARSKIKRLYNSVMGKGTRVIVISDFVAAYAQTTYTLPPDRLRLIHRGVDIGIFDSGAVSAGRIDTLRRAWNLPHSLPVILMPARITRWKGQSVLVAALAKLVRRDFICVIVGGRESGYGQELAGDIRAAGLEKNIIFCDTCRDMPAAYALSALVVAPSTRPEGFGRTVIEAQAMGVPVIASAHGGAMETIIPDETGWLVPSGDAAALALAIDHALGLSADERHLFYERAVSHVRARFSTEKMTTKTLEVYREILRTSQNYKDAKHD